MPSQSEPFANLVFLKNFSKGNKEIEKKYIAIFLRNTPDLMTVLEKQIKLKDLTAVEITAHSLKAQFNFVGFIDGENYARNIRNMAQEKKEVNEILTTFYLLKELCSELYKELEARDNNPQ